MSDRCPPGWCRSAQQAAEIASLKDRIDELEHYQQEAHEALECVTDDRTAQAAEIERLRAELVVMDEKWAARYNDLRIDKAKLVEALKIKENHKWP
jgi:DNA-binding transcriptional regulator YiaG